ncbi:trypsin-like peptidase domain-containing protein [Tumebacillus sp. ITR2]|uniref:Trypsin-like peptidase domain-containing protein n=1 Tax=Tumebacillus amylolyticus TaxID=2801339 RepID=A0ABS1J4A7_9BACL|nr:trypsin-like peptidase domain-containing protein [Tumebacillus amylolyticus]MBL0385103.1 trypsin-like peptidase domain-containing protein [Tumebacillus amylolyticus]
MGYYDDFENNKPAKKSGGNMTSWIAVALVSAVIGSGTTLVMVPKLINANMIQVNGNSSISNQKATTAGSTAIGNATNMSVNVNTGITEAVNKVKPAIVGVSNMQKQKDFFGRTKTNEDEVGTGSGVLFDKKGYIITNNHVVDGADDVEVSLPDGKHIKAKVLGSDFYTDLAVLKVDENDVKDITPATLGNSDSLSIGEPAIAIGNPLGAKFAQTVTVGVISALNRELPVTDEQSGQEVYSMNVIQTDAAINPGNSGGALVNINGEVVGINSAKIATSGVEGIGFSIPITEAQPIVQQLIDKGKIDRPVMGITPVNLADLPAKQRPEAPVDTGVVLYQVSDYAKKAGFEQGDVITKIDDTQVDDQIALRKALYKKQPGDKIKVEFYRGKEQKTIEMTLGKQGDVK